MLDAIELSEGRARGVAVVDVDTPEEELACLHVGGVRCVRFNFLKRLVGDAPKADHIRIAERVAALGWHIVVYFEGHELADLEPFVLSLPGSIVIDHMGRPAVVDGPEGAGFRRVRALTVRKVLARGWHFLIPFAALLHALFGLRMDPEDAALLASIVIVVAGFLRGHDGARLTLATLGRVFVDTGTSMVDLILVVAAAGFVIGVLNVTGLGFALTLVLVDAVGSSLFLLLMISAVVCIILGMGMPTSGAYVLLASLVAPALVEAGVQPIAAHLFILYFGMMSMITPPVALAAFAAAAISRARATRTGLAAMRIGWAAFILPFAFVATPALLFQGSLAEIALAATLTAVGIGAVTVGIAGYWARSPGRVLRLAFTGLGTLSLPLGFLDVTQGVHVAAAVAKPWPWSPTTTASRCARSRWSATCRC